MGKCRNFSCKFHVIYFAYENRSQYEGQMLDPFTLNDLNKNIAARVTGFVPNNSDSEIRLREIGFAEGDSVKALHFGLFGRNPITVSLNGALIALRKTDARIVIVEPVND